MFDRFRLLALGLICLSLAFTGCGSSTGVDSITVQPATVNFGAAGLTAQLKAIGTVGHGSHPATTEDVTDQVTWTSASSDVATVNSTGLVTSVGPGSISVTASLQGFTGLLTASSQVTVTTTTGTSGTNTDVVALTIIPSSQTVTTPNQTIQFIAIGTTASGVTENLTTQVGWKSSDTAVATIGATTGLATGVSQGTTTISAIATNGDGTVATGTATFTVASGGGTTNTDVTSLSIIPGTQAVASPGLSAQFIAIGTTASGVTDNLTTTAAWTSSSTSVATVGGNTGLAEAVAQGTSTITAIYKNGDGTVATGTATFSVTTGTTVPYTALTITPSSQSVSESGQTGSFVAIATASGGLTQDVTNSANITWSSSIPTIASVTSGQNAGNGVAQGVSPGTATITAELANGTNANGSPNVLTASATVTVTTVSAPEPLLSLTIIPSTLAVGNLQDTGNFLAVGTFSTVPYVRDLTNSVVWLSAFPNSFPVSSDNGVVNPGAPGGVVTAYGNGSATIIAEATSSDGTIQTATATFACPLVEPCPIPECEPPVAGSCFPGSQANGLLVTLTVYNEGLNTTSWEVTAPSATGTADVIHCGPGAGAGGSVCTATYPIDTTVTLTATGGAFGGWSDNCTPQQAISTGGPNSCTITLGEDGNSNVTVGAIFN